MSQVGVGDDEHEKWSNEYGMYNQPSSVSSNDCGFPGTDWKIG